jgi:putative ABC transport system ATP-binding protein
MEYAIEAIDIRKSFKIGNEEQELLKGLSFKIEKRDFTSIMGPSGCGKSTLLYILGGLDNPTSGSVKICGVKYEDMTKRQMAKIKRSKLGFVFQFYNLVPNLTVEDNIMLPIVLDGKKRKDYQNELKKILEITELSNKLKQTPRELSGGQQQRVAIARSLIFNPEIILADEPIGNLDSKTGETIMNLFKSVNHEFGTTIIQVTHSENSAMYGNSIIRMLDGTIKIISKVGEGQ